MASPERIRSTLEAAGYPMFSIVVTGVASAIVVPFDLSQRSAVDEEMESFDWSDEAEAAWLAQQQRDAAKEILTSQDAMPKATRNSDYALMISLQECRVKLNELITAVKAGDVSSVELLVTGDTLQDALGTIEQLIDAGVT